MNKIKIIRKVITEAKPLYWLFLWLLIPQAILNYFCWSWWIGDIYGLGFIAGQLFFSYQSYDEKKEFRQSVERLKALGVVKEWDLEVKDKEKCLGQQ